MRSWPVLVSYLALLLAVLGMTGTAWALSEDDGYQPNANGSVHTLTPSPNGTLVGGVFTAIGGGARGRVAVLNAAGRNSPSFNGPNVQNGPVHDSIAMPDGSLVIAGNFTTIDGFSANRVHRFDADGGPYDLPWFSANPNGAVRALAMHPVPDTGNHGVYIGGQFSQVGGNARAGVARLLWNGQLDTAFVPPEFAGTVHALATQPDGRLLVGGNIGFAWQPGARRLYRLNPDGSLDGSFLAQGMTSNDYTVHAIAIEDDGRILVAGEWSAPGNSGNGFVLRLNEDGSLDGDYDPPTLNGPVHALDLLPDGRAVIVGDFTTGAGPRSRVARLREDGTVDPSFGVLIVPNAAVRAVRVQDDGAVLIGGDFTSITGIARQRMARLDASGGLEQRLDAAFEHPSATTAVQQAAQQSDGRIIVAGIFTQVNGVNRARLARVLPNGALDSFAPVPNGGGVFAIAIQRDGRILIGGEFDSVNGQPRLRVARLEANGALDSNFNPNWPENTAPIRIHALAVDANGWVYTCGSSYLWLVSRLTPTGSHWPSFSPSFDGINRTCQSITVDGNQIAIGGRYEYTFGGPQYNFAILNSDGDHTAASPFDSVPRIYSLSRRHHGRYFAAGVLSLPDDPIRYSVASLNSSGNLVPGQQPWFFDVDSSGNYALTSQIAADGKLLVGLVGESAFEPPTKALVRFANPGTPIRQRIVWGTPGNPARLAWQRSSVADAPVALGTPRVLVSASCCDPAHFEPASGGGLMTASGNDWHLDGFTGLPGKFYAQIEYRVGNSRSSTTYRTPIQRLYGEVPPHTPTADLVARILLDPHEVAPGDTLLITVQVGNDGPDTATLPMARIDLPAGLTLQGHSADQGAFFPGDGLWMLDDMAPDTGGQLVMQAMVNPQGPYLIEAQAMAVQFDPNHNDNHAQAEPEVLHSESDMSVFIIVNPPDALPGETVVFTIRLDNDGPDTADGVHVQHLLPTGYSYQSHSLSQGSYSPASGQWQVGTMDFDEAAMLTVHATVHGSGGYITSASVGSYSFDPYPDNDLALASVDPFTDLGVSIEMAWLDDDAPIGTVTTRLTNHGPRTATGIEALHLRTGIVYWSHETDTGEYQPWSGKWLIGSLAPGETVELAVTGILFPDLTTTVDVTSDTYDLDPGNNSATLVVVPHPGSDLIFANGFETNID